MMRRTVIGCKTFRPATLVVVVLILLGFAFQINTQNVIDVQRSLVFGSLFTTKLTLPVRYFYIQAVDRFGKNLTSSFGKTAFEIKVQPKKGRARVWKEIIDRNDGSYLARFRLYDTHDDVVVEVIHNDRHVADSPYTIKGRLYHEECDCPLGDVKVMIKQAECQKEHQQLDIDMERFPMIDLERMRTEAISRFGKHHALCHYVINENKLYRKTYGEHVGFAMFMDSFLLSLMRKVRLPDVEFFVNLGDWPLETKLDNPIPILSWCGSDTTADIVMPTYDIMSSTLEALGRVSLDMMSVQGHGTPHWSDKIAKGFFRGRDSRQERLDLVEKGRNKTDLFDVGLTNYFFFKHDEEKYGPKEKHVPFFDFFKNKYQINIDGTVAAYRLPYLLAGDSLVLKQDSPYYEHFYSDLKPWKHYVPFKRDLSDLEEKIQWAKKHDIMAQHIGLHGQRFARSKLMPENIYCYMMQLFDIYASKQIQSPIHTPEMTHILPEESIMTSKCECRKNDELTENHSEL